MDDWKHLSQFTDFIAESSTFPTAPPSPGPEHRPSQPGKDDLEAYQRTLEQLQKVESHLKHSKEDLTLVQRITGFLKGSRKISPTLSIAHQYERLQPLRTWLFWLPVGYLQKFGGAGNSLVVIAHLYTVALLMERLFPEIGAAYFGSLSLGPVEEIARRLMSINLSTGLDHESQTPLALMEFPIDVVGEFRSRMGWVHPARTPSFPQFHPPNFNMNEDAAQGYTPYGTPAFSYSAEDVSILNGPAATRHGVSPLTLASPFPSQQYLSIPSPSYVGAYSPASSTFEGSVTYSDSEDFATFDMGGYSSNQSHIYGDSSHSYGLGFVSPTQPVWI